MPKEFNSGDLFFLNSKFWFWPFFAGVCFGLGYTLTKYLYRPKSHREQALQENLKHAFKNKELPDPKNTNEDKLKKINLTNSLKTNKKFEKIINIPTADNSYRKLTFIYDQSQNSQKKEFFKSSFSFFKKNNVKTLINTLSNTKKE